MVGQAELAGFLAMKAIKDGETTKGNCLAANIENGM
jgi:hypothetical protein